MKSFISRASIAAAAALVPGFALAQDADQLDFSTLSGIIFSLNTLIQIIFGILLGIAVLVLAYGIFKFIARAGDENARKEGRSFILWGILGIFVMVSIWGLVNILVNTLSLNNEPTTVPNIVPPSSFDGDIFGPGGGAGI